MTTTIHSNGSKWAGEDPDTIEQLIAVLGREHLDPKFELYGGFIQRGESWPGVRFFGNFENLSHVFRIDTDDPQVIQVLTTAIEANVQTPAYQDARRRLIAWLKAEQDRAEARQKAREREQRRYRR